RGRPPGGGKPQASPAQDVVASASRTANVQLSTAPRLPDHPRVPQSLRHCSCEETLMNAAVKLAALVLATAPLVGAAQEAPKLSCIKDITFSQEFLARYPKAGAACREVVQKDGQKWVRFDADVANVAGNRVTADFKDDYGNPVETVTFEAAPDARVSVNGKDVKFSSLQKGDTLSFWMAEARLGFYGTPGTKGSSKLAVVSDTSKQR